MPKITSKTIKSAHLKSNKSSSAFFIRDSELKGFALRVFPSGTIKYIVEVWYNRRSHRKTLGSYPVLSLKDARQEALSFIRDVQLDILDKKQEMEQVTTLSQLFEDYIKGDRLKASTKKNYKEVIYFHLQDWLDRPVSSISKQMVEKRFYRISDKGMFGGIPTYSSATKTMRILSALMNYAMADESIDSNPVYVLKYKRVDRSMRKRDRYLRLEDARKLLSISAQDRHPVTLAIHLMLHTGLRKNEALRLKWSDMETINGVECLLIRETKNDRTHYVPVTPAILIILDKCSRTTDFILPSPAKKNCHISDERHTVRRLCKSLGVTFTCHDLRRTFATRASEVGNDHMAIKRMLNHKTNDITSQYIQRNSRENLSAMSKALESITY
jgi:integrase